MQQLQENQADESLHETMGTIHQSSTERHIVKVRDNQFGFRPGMSTTEPVFALRQLEEKCREKN